jgi:DNA-binding response OmpR family regulator
VVDEHEFDLAFLDMNMPGIGGLGVLRAIRAKNVPYPIIAVTSVSDRDTMIRAIELGVKSYLLKPIKPEDIFMKSVEILKSNF